MPGNHSISPAAGGIPLAIVTAAASVTFLKAIQECSDILPPLKLVVTIAVIIVEKIQLIKACHEQWKRFGHLIAHRVETIVRHLGRGENYGDPELIHHLTELYHALHQICLRIGQYMRLSMTRRIVHHIQEPGELSELRNLFQEALDSFLFATHIKILFGLPKSQGPGTGQEESGVIPCPFHLENRNPSNTLPSPVQLEAPGGVAGRNFASTSHNPPGEIWNNVTKPHLSRRQSPSLQGAFQLMNSVAYSPTKAS